MRFFDHLVVSGLLCWAILQFLHHMFNVSALLLDDALLKCSDTEVALFSVVAFNTLIFHKRHI